MKLRGQLAAAAMLVALLPLAGIGFLGQVERLLRQGHEQALTDSARSLAALIERRSDDAPAFEQPALYLHRARAAPLLDGYADDWLGWTDEAMGFNEATRRPQPAHQSPDAGYPLKVMSARDHGAIYVYFQMHDDDVRFAAADGRNGEAVSLELVQSDATVALDLMPAAPGPVLHVDSSTGGLLVSGYWQARARGWSLELRIPLRGEPETLQFEVLDRNAAGQTVARYGGSEPAQLVQRDPALDRLLSRSVPDARAWLTRADGLVLAYTDNSTADGRSDSRSDGSSEGIIDDAGSDESGSSDPDRGQLVDLLVGARLAEGQDWAAGTVRLEGPEIDAAREGRVEPAWQRIGPEQDIRARVAVNVDRPGNGSRLLVVERDAGELLLLANRAVVQLLGTSLAVFMAIALLLLGFALLLSLRIRRLSDAAQRSVAADGRVSGVPAPAQARDEIGDLSRTVSELLQRLQTHQRYLQTLADKLSHELRTPLTMIRSSLDNLDDELATCEPSVREALSTYVDRAGQGGQRLNRIFQAMSQAARLEEGLIDEPLVRLDLAELIEEYGRAIRSVIPERRFEIRRPTGPCEVLGSADLLAQLLDKLVDNAVGFSPGDSTVTIELRRVDERPDGERWRLEVVNEGPSLEPGRTGQLFESMVSYREARTDRPHLGLGLYIVKLIVQRHGGRIIARPTETGSAFGFSLAVAAPAP